MIQDIFERVSNHLQAQNERAVDENGKCRYLTGSKKCAIGCLIEKYHPAMEQMSPYMIQQRFPDAFFRPLKGDEEYELLGRLQNIHDTMPPTSWVLEMSYIAEEYDCYAV